MSERNIAKLFMHGRSQAVRLPKEFRFPGTQVKVTRTDDGVLLQTMSRTREDISAVFRELEKYHHIPFMEDGREQSPMPDDDDEITFD